MVCPRAIDSSGLRRLVVEATQEHPKQIAALYRSTRSEAIRSNAYVGRDKLSPAVLYLPLRQNRINGMCRQVIAETTRIFRGGSDTRADTNLLIFPTVH